MESKRQFQNQLLNQLSRRKLKKHTKMANICFNNFKLQFKMNVDHKIPMIVFFVRKIYNVKNII